MAMSKANGTAVQRKEKSARSGKRTKTPSGDFKSNKADVPPAPSARTDLGLPIPKKSKSKKHTKKKESSGKASRSVSKKKSAATRKKKSKPASSVAKPVPDLAAISQLQRPKTARGSRNRGKMSVRESVERPQTARGNRSRRRKDRGTFGLNAPHPGIVDWEKSSLPAEESILLQKKQPTLKCSVR